MKKFNLSKEEVTMLRPIQAEVTAAKNKLEFYTDGFNKRINKQILPRIGQQNIPDGSNIMVNLDEGIITTDEIQKPSKFDIRNILKKDKNTN